MFLFHVDGFKLSTFSFDSEILPTFLIILNLPISSTAYLDLISSTILNSFNVVARLWASTLRDERELKPSLLAKGKIRPKFDRLILKSSESYSKDLNCLNY